MYEDDLYHPNYEETYEGDYAGEFEPPLDDPALFNAYEESVISSVSTARNRRRRTMDEALKADPGFCSIVRTINRKKVAIRFYHTRTTPGSTIRNAVTGQYETNFRVGSKDEDLYFKVCNSYGYKDSRDPYILFFDNPEQYERLFCCSLSADIKEAWVNKVVAARAARQSEKEPKRTMVVVH